MKTHMKSDRSTKLLGSVSLLSALLLCAPLASAAGVSNDNDYPLFSRVTPKVDLGGAGNFVLLTETGITNVPTSAITGNVGVSPITGAADLLTCDQVTGRIVSVDVAGPAPCGLTNPSRLTIDVNDMQTAYTDAAGRTPTTIDKRAGNIGGLTLRPGVYKWNSGVTIPSNLTLKGGSHAVWIFQIAGGLDVSSGAAIVLAKQAQAQNIFWQIAGPVTVGAGAHLEGIFLAKTSISMVTGASINGRLLAQTAVNLQMNTVTAP
jgi:ice-binding like protein